MKQKKRMAAGLFKAKCLKIMDEVQASGQELIITKRSLPIVKLSPISPSEFSVYGCLRGTVNINEDITQPIGEDWNADY